MKIKQEDLNYLLYVIDDKITDFSNEASFQLDRISYKASLENYDETAQELWLLKFNYYDILFIFNNALKVIRECGGDIPIWLLAKCAGLAKAIGEDYVNLCELLSKEDYNGICKKLKTLNHKCCIEEAQKQYVLKGFKTFDLEPLDDVF